MIPAPAAFDVLRAAGAYGWPAVELPDGRTLEGEPAWREAVTDDAPSGDRLGAWQALQVRARLLREDQEADEDEDAPW